MDKLERLLTLLLVLLETPRALSADELRERVGGYDDLRRYLGKPVYVLVGPKTYSAGEEFAYDLQVLKRVTVVGEKTRGGANPGGLKELGSDLFVVVPTGRAENPITHSNWGGVGVRPDVQATLGATQETAVALAKGQPATQLAR